MGFEIHLWSSAKAKENIINGQHKYGCGLHQMVYKS